MSTRATVLLQVATASHQLSTLSLEFAFDDDDNNMRERESERAPEKYCPSPDDVFHVCHILQIKPLKLQ